MPALLHVLLWLSATLLAGAASAHPLAPALLSVHEIAPERYAVLWRSSLVRVRGAELAPQWPPACTAERQDAGIDSDEAAWVEHWTLHCAGGLEGRQLGINGLDRAGINVILRLQPLHGASQQALLDGGRSHYVVAPADTAPGVFARYLGLGVEHLLFGPDHLLFVLGLLLLVRGLRPLVWTITAFTLGHSLTLSLAALGLVRVNPMLTELAIAASLLWLAVAILRRQQAAPRRPWLFAAGFGLLHGLGFAGALAETGLPLDEIGPALLAFNIGIELGQLAVVAGALGLAWLVRRLRTDAASWMAVRPASAYVIGTMAAYWCWDRGAVLWL
jgi:hydrogenase/urease accessory protein HupE